MGQLVSKDLEWVLSISSDDDEPGGWKREAGAPGGHFVPRHRIKLRLAPHHHEHQRAKGATAEPVPNCGAIRLLG